MTGTRLPPMDKAHLVAALRQQAKSMFLQANTARNLAHAISWLPEKGLLLEAALAAETAAAQLENRAQLLDEGRAG